MDDDGWPLGVSRDMTTWNVETHKTYGAQVRALKERQRQLECDDHHWRVLHETKFIGPPGKQVESWPVQQTLMCKKCYAYYTPLRVCLVCDHILWQTSKSVLCRECGNTKNQ